MSCALLENAKTQYKTLRFKTQPSVPITSTISTIPSGQDNPIRMALKRPAPNKPSATVIEIQKRFFPENMVIKSTPQHQPQIIPTLIPSQSSTSFVQQQPQQQQKLITPVSVASQQPRRQIFWNTAHISTSTKFVLDVQANQAFGFGTEGGKERERRLASKHPELIRYLPDNEDRDWLVSQQIIPQPNRNSRFLFLIYDEVCRLYQTHEVYKSKASIDLSVMMTFTVPEFMIQKMKIFFVDLNIKSRGLITNSYSISGSQTPSVAQSHLRNALLLGTSQATVTVTSATVATSTNICNSGAMTDTSQNIGIVPIPSPSTNIQTTSSSSTSSITSTEGLLQQKPPKSSNLSSSHATLTALLNNSSATTNEKSINTSTTATSNLASSTPSLLNKLRK